MSYTSSSVVYGILCFAMEILTHYTFPTTEVKIDFFSILCILVVLYTRNQSGFRSRTVKQYYWNWVLLFFVS